MARDSAQALCPKDSRSSSYTITWCEGGKALHPPSAGGVNQIVLSYNKIKDEGRCARRSTQDEQEPQGLQFIIAKLARTAPKHSRLPCRRAPRC